MTVSERQLESIVVFYEDNQHRLEQFQASVVSFFSKHRLLNAQTFPIVHSVKFRMKDPEHLKEKLTRKINDGRVITSDNLFSQITDLIGVRVLHLYHDQFPTIHQEISKQIEEGDWAFVEQPKAFTWDPESEETYTSLGIECERKDTFYTSVHYVVKPNNANPNPVCCEIQVRTLFEEIWGEIAHSINYPNPIDDVACNEQLRVLSKLVSTGTRLADSIFRTYNAHQQSSSVKPEERKD